ncbi:MAG TPA: hypothetical protein ENI64_03180 [Gammaproteobacteria bacterium]|nr:hypothetical protein [Gammaproteobacteria bacterium]
MVLSSTSFRYLIKALIVVAALYVYQAGTTLWSSGDDASLSVREDELENTLRKIKKQYSVDIIYNSDVSAFPDLFRLPPASVYAKRLTNSIEHKQNIARVVGILSVELKKYPDSIVGPELNSIYLFSKMGIYNVPYGGTSIDDVIYMAIGEKRSDHNDLYITRLFHHEMSSVFFRRYKFPVDEWVKINPKGFSYKTKTDEVVKMVDENRNLDGSAVLYQQGFLDEYGKATVEEDFNMYSEMAFAQPGRLKALQEKYPAIYKKIEILKKYYLGVSVKFTSVFVSF